MKSRTVNSSRLTGKMKSSKQGGIRKDETIYILRSGVLCIALLNDSDSGNDLEHPAVRCVNGNIIRLRKTLEGDDVSVDAENRRRNRRGV